MERPWLAAKTRKRCFTGNARLRIVSVVLLNLNSALLALLSMMIWGI